MQGFQLGYGALPPVVKNLLIINGLMFLATVSVGHSMQIDLNQLLGLHYWGSEMFRPYQIITYMFMHGGELHLFMNMFGLWMFGRSIETVWGSRKFLVYYLITGVGAAALHYGIVYVEMAPLLNAANSVLDSGSLDSINSFMLRPDVIEITRSKIELVNLYNEFIHQPNTGAGSNFVSTFITEYQNGPVVVGASGALFGILLAFGMLFPNVELLMLFFPVPIKAKYFVMGYGALELYNGLQNNPGDNVAHFAHLGGMLFGYLLIRYWRSNPTRF